MPEKGAPPNVHPVQRRVLKALGALSTPLLPDDYLEMINPLWSTRELRGRIEEVKLETEDAATIFIKPGYRWPGHKPGQYCRIGVDIDGVRHWRAYSLTSDPYQGRPDQHHAEEGRLGEGVALPGRRRARHGGRPRWHRRRLRATRRPAGKAAVHQRRQRGHP